jgi:hypothetical protein
LVAAGDEAGGPKFGFGQVTDHACDLDAATAGLVTVAGP